MRLCAIRNATLVALTYSLALAGCSDGSDSNGATANCGELAAKALQVCISSVNNAQGACYGDGGSSCDNSNADILAAQDTLQTSVQNSCADGEFKGLAQDAVVGRFQNACQAQPDSIAWRTFGGPQGAVLPEATDEQRNCLRTAHATVSQFFDEALVAVNECLSGDDCDADELQGNQQDAAAAAAAAIADACPALPELIAVDAETYVARAEDQIDCTAATAHESTAPLEPQCGPGNVDTMPPRGEWTQIVLDGEQWGTMCGDGTEYAMQVKLAPEGSPVDRIVIGLEGGGVCLFAEDCRERLASAPDLFNALDNGPPVAGGLVGDSPDNPFVDWTIVYLPYCNQDVFTGGGVVEAFENSDFKLPRYGTINLRAGMRVVRDILWKEMDKAGDTGFRPDQLIALFGGFSAGGYGALYNYHWVLDDLQWPRTAAYPDAGGALDNGEPLLGVRGVGLVKIPAWGAKPYLPPYCFSADCAIGPENYKAISPRLKRVPEQQYLILSNQKDNTQQGDAFFDDEAQWIDAMRSAYCDTKDLNGIQWYLTSDSINSVHVVSIRDEFYYGDVAGERMVDWFWRAVTDPDSIADRAEEGSFTTDIPGSNPFPCELPL